MMKRPNTCSNKWIRFYILGVCLARVAVTPPLWKDEKMQENGWMDRNKWSVGVAIGRRVSQKTSLALNQRRGRDKRRGLISSLLLTTQTQQYNTASLRYFVVQIKERRR